MADRTQLQLFVHDCPDDQAPAAVSVLADWGLCVDWDGRAAEHGALLIGTPYTERMAALDAADELAAELIDRAPGIMFTVWTDPKNEWLGSIVRYVPELGRHDGECDESGQGQYTEWQILAALAKGGESAVRALVGAAWTKALTGTTVERTITYTPEGA
jgi:hypothetical protein